MRTIIPFAPLLLALAACGGGSSDTPTQGVTPDGGACELPAKVLNERCAGDAGGPAGPLRYVVGFTDNAPRCAIVDIYPPFCPAAEAHPQGCAAYDTQICCCR